MGYYIQTPYKKGKAEQLCLMYQEAKIIPQPTSLDAIPPGMAGMALICVVDNGPVEAAVYCYNPREFEEFTRPSETRSRKWVIMPRELAEKLSGYKK